MAETLLLELGIGLTGLAIAGALADRIGLSVIPAYILVGVLIGPNSPLPLLGIPLDLVSKNAVIDILAELGVVFLLFFLGLEFSVQQLLQDRGRILKVGSVDFGLNFGAGLVLGFMFGWSLVESLFLAGIVYISSSAVITKSLIERGWEVNPESHPILGTLVFEDILIAVYLAVISALVQGSGAAEAIHSVLTAFLFLGILTAFTWYGADAFEHVFRTTNNEGFLLRVLAVTVLVAGIAVATGVSEAVAAFFIGAAFNQTNHIDRIEHIISPIKDLFAAVFFFAIGLTTDVAALSSLLGLLALVVVVTTVSKFSSGTFAGRAYGLDVRRSIRAGLGLIPRGEFSLVIAALAANATGTSRVLGTIIPAFAVGYVLVMSVTGTVLIQWSDFLTNPVEKWLVWNRPRRRWRRIVRDRF